MAKQQFSVFDQKTAQAIIELVRRELGRRPSAGSPPEGRIWSRKQSLALVDVEANTGSAGDTTTACSFAYDWTDPDGGTHTDSSPLWHRQSGRLGAYIAAEHGLAERQDDGTWTLVMVDETPDLDDPDGSKGWGTPACVPVCYKADQAEPDREPAAGGGSCDGASLSRCRATITAVLAGFGAPYDGTQNLTYGSLPGRPTDWGIDLGGGNIIFVQCGLNGNPKHWIMYTDGSIYSAGYIDTTRSCPPLGDLTSTPHPTRPSPTLPWPGGATAAIIA